MKAVILVFLLLPFILSGQTKFYDFEDNLIPGSFQSDDDRWCIDNVNPISGEYSLRHCFDNDAAGTDVITFYHEPLSPADSCSWEFKIRYGQNPSARNNWNVLIGRNSIYGTKEENMNGLVIGLNFNTSDDILSVWEVNEGKTDILLSTGFNWEQQIGRRKALKVGVTYDGKIYSLKIDTGNVEIELGKFTPLNRHEFNTFSLCYEYTATYDRSVWFDDLRIEGRFIRDEDLPALVSYSVVNANTLEVRFSEPVTVQGSALWCVDGIGCASNLMKFHSTVIIDFPRPFATGNLYELIIPDLTDIYGNRQATHRHPVYIPAPTDIIINEIMADPSPPVLMPEAEYIELYNASGMPVNIKKWRVRINSRELVLPEYILHADSFLILTHIENSGVFGKNNCLGLSRFPPIANAGALILILDRSGRLVHAVDFKSTWFETGWKKEGGWSLEMINPEDACRGKPNWRECNSFGGGTAGERNSVYSARTVNLPPELWRAAVTDTGSLMLYFSEPLDSSRLNRLNYFSVDNGIRSPYLVIPSWPIADKAELFFEKEFLTGVQYTVRLTSDICDCSGNSIKQPASAVFSVPETADFSDIVLNEILFDPMQGHREFLELYNRSEKNIDLKNFSLIVGERTGRKAEITRDYWPIAPHQYCLLAADYSGIDSPGEFTRAERIICMAPMPALRNTGNSVYLLSAEEMIIDSIRYLPDWHHKILVSTRGVSLERNTPSSLGFVQESWHSASTDAGYMTPAAPNSQLLQEYQEFSVKLDREFITPDHEGSNGKLTIEYEMPEEGYMAQLMIFGMNGKRYRTLANGSILGITGSYIFDGRAEGRNILPAGYYIVFFHAYNENGRSFTYKKAFVVAR